MPHNAQTLVTGVLPELQRNLGAGRVIADAMRSGSEATPTPYTAVAGNLFAQEAGIANPSTTAFPSA